MAQLTKGADTLDRHEFAMPLSLVGSTMRILVHAAREIMADQVSFVASGVAFRVALAIFPGIALPVWLGSQCLSPSDVRALLHTPSSRWRAVVSAAGLRNTAGAILREANGEYRNDSGGVAAKSWQAAG